MKQGFTLAEVLITIGIIGVVAAMTLPSVILNYQEKATMTKVKKAYSIINQAYQKASFDNSGTINTWNCSSGNCIYEFFTKYFNNIKTCGENPCKITFQIVGSTGQNMTSKSPAFYTALADGITIFWYDSYENIYIITSGFKATETNSTTPIKLIANKNSFHLSLSPNFPKAGTMACGDSWDPVNLYKGGPGNGCPASAVDWIMKYENMDYLRCAQKMKDNGTNSCK